MHPRWTVALAVAAATVFAARRAPGAGWLEAHQTGDDVEIHVESDGIAAVRNLLRWRVVHGPLRSIDLENVDADAALEPAVGVMGDDGQPLSAHLVRREATSARIEMDDPRKFMRGTFTFDVRWRIDWVKSRAFVRDGVSWRVSWSSPAAAAGFDSARATLDLPAAPEPPQVILPDTGLPDDSAISTLRRGTARDVLELVRPHVGRGESVMWTVRVDPRGFPAVTDSRLRAAPELRPPPEPDRVRAVSIAMALTGIALLFGFLVAHKARAFEAVCAERSLRARPLIPLPDSARATVAGGALAVGVALEFIELPTLGAAFVALAVLAAALRGPEPALLARGPGQWLVLRPDDAFVREPMRAHWLDIGCAAGRASACVVLAALAVAIFALRRIDGEVPWFLALDSAAFVPLFVTGRSRDVPPDAGKRAASWLSSIFRRLKTIETLRVVPWARIVLGGSMVDELRLLVLPRAVMPGLVGVEVGQAWSVTPLGWAATPEVLVRVLDESSAAAKLAKVLPRARCLPGRRPDERVVRLSPRVATTAGTVALTRGLAEALADRRVAVPAPPREAGSERRVDRVPRCPAPPNRPAQHSVAPL